MLKLVKVLSDYQMCFRQHLAKKKNLEVRTFDFREVFFIFMSFLETLSESCLNLSIPSNFGLAKLGNNLSESIGNNNSRNFVKYAFLF